MSDYQSEPWRKNLIVGANGSPKPLLANAITALRDAPQWQGLLSFDAFASQAMLDDVPPWSPEYNGIDWEPRPWSPQDDLNLTDWLQRRGIGVNDTVAAKAVEAVARDNTFHPVLDYLESLQHDARLVWELGSPNISGRSNRPTPKLWGEPCSLVPSPVSQALVARWTTFQSLKVSRERGSLRRSRPLRSLVQR